MKSIGENLFRLQKDGRPLPIPSLQRVNAKTLGLQESWFRDAIFAEPELVIGPCRMAGRVDSDEVWLPWRIETNFGSGPIDVLLVSSHGRIAIIETKLSYNPQKRREVVAQVLDYALSLQETDREDLPELPNHSSAPLEEDFVECLQAGRFLLIIAGDALDPRALRLSQSMLARHLTSEWDLAMVDLNVYRTTQDDDALVMVPELLGTVQSDLRQVVRVVVEGQSPKARVVVDKIVHEEDRGGRYTKLRSVDELLAAIEASTPVQLPVARKIVEEMQRVASQSDGILTFGLQPTSASLYHDSPVGPRRFLSLRTDGRLRIVLAYLRAAGLDNVIEKVVAAAKPVILIESDDRAAGTRYTSTNESSLLELVNRIGRACS